MRSRSPAPGSTGVAAPANRRTSSACIRGRLLVIWPLLDIFLMSPANSTPSFWPSCRPRSNSVILLGVSSSNVGIRISSPFRASPLLVLLVLLVLLLFPLGLGRRRRLQLRPARPARLA